MAVAEVHQGAAVSPHAVQVTHHAQVTHSLEKMLGQVRGGHTGQVPVELAQQQELPLLDRV